MKERDDDEWLDGQPAPAADTTTPGTDIPADATEGEQKEVRPSALEQLRQNVKEDDNAPVATLTLRKILGGDYLSADLVRGQIWVVVLVVFFTTVYVAFRYQCQQDMITIDNMEKELLDAKYKALSASSNLTEKCRESQVIEMLRQNRDSLLHASEQPPYIITVPDE